MTPAHGTGCARESETLLKSYPVVQRKSKAKRRKLGGWCLKIRQNIQDSIYSRTPHLAIWLQQWRPNNSAQNFIRGVLKLKRHRFESCRMQGFLFFSPLLLYFVKNQYSVPKWVPKGGASILMVRLTKNRISGCAGRGEARLI